MIRRMTGLKSLKTFSHRNSYLQMKFFSFLHCFVYLFLLNLSIKPCYKLLKIFERLISLSYSFFQIHMAINYLGYTCSLLQNFICFYLSIYHPLMLKTSKIFLSIPFPLYFYNHIFF